MREKRFIQKSGLTPRFVSPSAPRGLITAILALGLLFSSCDDFLKPNKRTVVETPPDYEGLEQRDFWAQDMRNSSFYQTRAARLYEGEKCVIWAELSSKVSIAAAQAIAWEYDNRIASNIVEIFGIGEICDENDNFIGNSLDYADYLTDGDGKLCILLLDIRDGYKNDADSYTAGYFSPGNFYSRQNHLYSNETDMMYIDTYPSTPGSPQSNSTFAHELQHLINFVNSSILRRSDTGVRYMDTWIDEGLSVSAEYIYQGEHPEIRYKWFIQDRAGTISKGNNFFVWDNHEETNAILDEYATVYLFFQWLRLQSGGGNKIYRAIANSGRGDQNAVLEAASGFFNSDSKSYAADWETLLRTWLAANYINRSSGVYGYQNDSVLKWVRVWAIGGSSQDLYPGEGVYSQTTRGSASPAGAGGHIRYGGLSKNRDPDFTGPSYSGDRLLTFNMNSDRQGGAENGILSNGQADSREAVLAASRQAWEVPKSLPLDARDISKNFRRNERDLLSRFAREGKDAAE
jgi:hypothetical protein